jgi:hypothetical protein
MCKYHYCPAICPGSHHTHSGIFLEERQKDQCKKPDWAKTICMNPPHSIVVQGCEGRDPRGASGNAALPTFPAALCELCRLVETEWAQLPGYRA